MGVGDVDGRTLRFDVGDVVNRVLPVLNQLLTVEETKNGNGGGTLVSLFRFIRKIWLVYPRDEDRSERGRRVTVVGG